MKNSLSLSIAAKWGLALRLEQTRKSLLWCDFVLFSATLLMDWVENNEHDDEIRQQLLRRKGWMIDRRTILSVESLHLPMQSMHFGNRCNEMMMGGDREEIDIRIGDRRWERCGKKARVRCGSRARPVGTILITERWPLYQQATTAVATTMTTAMDTTAISSLTLRWY